jgi:transcriptional regulator with XRE-family HTH domain
MSKGKSQERQTTALSKAIRELRQALGVTQEGMARQLGCTLSGYIQWEKGRRVPGGEWLLKLMALCPDDETRSLFEEQVNSFRRLSPAPAAAAAAPARGSSTTPAQRRQARAMCREAIDILFELGEAGYRPADQKLRQFADELNRVAGDFSRVFPPPK